MAAEFKIGRLRYNWAGAWSASTAYARDNVVQYQGKTYVCLVPNTASSNFYNDLNASPYPYWKLMMDGKTFKGPWTSATLYSLGNIVISGGITYYCVNSHTSSVFATDAANGDWSVYTYATGWHPTWQPGTAYSVNDIIAYGGIVYECTVNHTSAGSVSLGLEANQSNWTVYFSGVNYAGIWTPTTRYKANDLVQVNANIYICLTGHTSESPVFTGTSNWAVWLPGSDFKAVWNSTTTYELGDAVIYGGDAYISITANNVNLLPSVYNANWAIFNQGYSIQNDWMTGASYNIGSVVRRNGMLYEAVGTTYGNSPSTGTSIGVYVSSGSSGTTVVLSSVSGISVGMIVSGVGFTLGQTVSSINTNTNTLILDRRPDGTLTNGQNLTFYGVTSTYWKILIPGKQWNNRWVLGSTYTTGDVVTWINGTYTCIQEHLSSSASRPDQDTTNSFWTLLIAHNKNNAMTTYGDLETFQNGAYTPVHIGPTTYLLRDTNGVPNWSKINVAPSVYYVDAIGGQDIPTFGTNWDQPWQTIKYACNFVGAGAYFPLTSAAFVANKVWMITEMYQWMLYQMNNSISPFSPTSLWDPTYTQRDAGYIIDALVYDMQRGGNSQIVAATLKFFFYGSSTQFVNSLVEASIQYFPPSLNYLLYLMQCVASNIAPTVSYQTLNGVAGANYVPQYFSASTGAAEAGITLEINSLMSILITALTNQNTYLVPASNTGLTAIINVKTGTYNESLPITVYENISIIGDELRSTTVQPATSVQFYCTQTIGGPNTVIVNSTVGLTDQMPMQFISPYVNNASTTFGGVVSGQTYYIIGSSITSTSFQIANAATTTIVGTSVANSNTLVNVSNIIKLTVGMSITGPNIPAGTTIVSFTQAISGVSTVVMSAAATNAGLYQTFTCTGQTVTLTTGSGSMLCYAGDCLKNMFLMRNGTTMRNFSMFGLLGTLTAQDAYGLARPSGGAYTSLDPGNGPDDTSVWILRRSPYMQNITNFGTGCVGTKVDGSLHGGGSKSMLHNDYTQVLSDGIGVYITGSGAISECVSVFSYYNYIGHFAEAGGRIRSTNGNSSYGTYGAVSEGYDVNESPVTGTIFNESTQTQATVASAFGTASQLLKLNFQNAGSGYINPTTNLLQNSNNFIASPWNTDGNITFIKNETAPTGYTEGWLLTGTKSTQGTGYLYQNITINPAGATYTGVSGTSISGSGSGATFNVYVTNAQYVISVANPGSLYAVTNQILITGANLGGVTGVNDLTITVTGLSGSGIASASVSGTVPSGSSQSYTLSMYVYAGTSTTVDLQGIFSGTASLTSGISYNVSTNVCTPYSIGTYTVAGSTLNAFTPVQYGAQKTLVPGWYRIWLAVQDVAGINNSLQIRVYPQGYTSPVAGTFSIFYAAQAEISNSGFSPDFYLETKSTTFTAYCNYEIVGAGSGAVLLGDELRSGAVFNARITADSNGITGGLGYVTASNNAVTGTSNTVTLATTEQGVNNYLGMRVFIQSGTGAGQYGYISTYNNSTKVIQVLQEGFESMSITQTASGSNLLTIQTGTDLSKLYLNLPVQFTPTYYTTLVSQTSITSMVVTAAFGGTTNVLVVATTAPLALNMPITFSGSTFSTVTSTYTYYIVGIDNSTGSFAGTISGSTLTVTGTVTGTLEIGQLLTGGSVLAGTYVTNGSGTTWTVSKPQTSTCTGSQATLIQISATQYGATWQLSTVLSGSMNMSYPDYYRYLTAASTSNMIPNIPIQFTGSSLGGLSLGTTYYINDVIDSYNFTVSSLLVTTTVTASAGGVNTLTGPTGSLIPLNPIVFSGTILDANIVTGTKYYISNIIDASTFQITSTIITATASATAVTSNYITVSSITGMVVNQPIKFTGLAFGGITAEQLYYIQSINSGTSQITVSATITGGVAGTAISLGTAVGAMIVKTCPTALTLSGTPGAGSMTGTSTNAKLVVTNATGSMNATFSTSVFGGVSGTTVYYVTSISGYNIQISTTQGGTPLTLTSATGTMQMGASGFDHVNPGTPIANVLTSTSAYYIEPRAIFAAPSFSQTAASSVVSLSPGVTYTAIANGNTIFMALPSSGTTGAVSVDGSTWSAITLPGPGTYNWSSLAFGNNYWIATVTGSNIVAYSNSNGAGWRTTTMPSSATWSNIVYGNGVFVAIASGTTNAAYTTNYGASWTASTLVTDNTITAAGSAQLSTSTYEFGTASLSLNGTNSNITIPSNSDFAFGAGDFTVELWVYISSTSTAQNILDFRTASIDAAIAIDTNTSGNVRVYINGAYVIVGNSTLSTNTWTHVALSRTSGATRLFVGGTLQSTTYSDSNFYSARPLVVGSGWSSAGWFGGNIDELRITKGASRYTATFTPAAAAFTADPVTVLLLHFDGTNASTTFTNSATTGVWTSLAYGAGLFFAMSSTGEGVWSSNGTTWQPAALPTNSTVLSGTAAVGSAGQFSCTPASAPLVVGQAVLISGIINSGATGAINSYTSGNVYYIIATNGLSTFTLSTSINGSAITTTAGSLTGLSFIVGIPNYTGLAFGNGRFVAVQSGIGLYAAYSFDGVTWYKSNNYVSGTLISYGQGCFLTVSNNNTTSYKTDSGLWWNQNTITSYPYSAMTFGYAGLTVNGTLSNVQITNTSGSFSCSATTLVIGQQVVMTGTFSSGTVGGNTTLASSRYYIIATNGSTTFTLSATLSDNSIVTTVSTGVITGVTFTLRTVDKGVFTTLSGNSPYNGTIISAGIRAQGRPSINSSVMTSVSLWEPGSNYTSNPTATFTDFNISIISQVTARIGNNALSNPTFISRGNGYNTSSTAISITGNGYADTYQIGYTVIMNNLSSIPLVGSNLTIVGNPQIYKVTSATAVYGTQAPFIEASVQLSPSMTNALSPANATQVTIRQLYSQCRLTNHDFLSIGVGNFAQTNYPNVNSSNQKPNNEVVETNQGRVFYTSTDQDGNFLVGGLFGVEQATGTVTLSATQFGLVGLQTLSLGGIAVGSSSVVVTQFSTDGTFTANSDAVVPTQRAIKTYLTGRLSQGGSNTYTGELIAGSTVVGGVNLITSSIPQGVAGSTTKMASKVYFGVSPGTGAQNIGVDGELAALDFFARNAWHKTTMF